jgi:hypothetical protein
MQNHTPHHAPWRLALIVAGLALALLLVWSLRDTFDPVRRAEAERQYERQGQLDDQLSTLDLFVSAFWRVLPIVAVPALATYAAWVLLALVYNRWGSRETVLKHHETQHARATEQRFPMLASLSYSYHDSSRPQIAPQVETEATPALLSSPIPTFGELLDTGTIGPERPLLLGFDAATGQPIEGSWKSLYSCGIGALQGAGKSWLAAFLLAQSALQGGKIILCDPHAGDDESLATRIAPLAPAFMCAVAQTEREILDALKMARDKLDRRKAGQAGRWPIIVACDEWTSLLRGELGEVLPLYAADFAEQGRKYGVNALLSAQGWTKDVAGTVRNRLTAHYVLRQRPDEARYQLGLRAAALPDDIRTLPDATGYLLTVNGDLRKVVIPRMTAADIVQVGEMLADLNRPGKLPIGFRLPDTGYHQATTASAPTAPLVANGKPDGSLMVAYDNQATTASQSHGSLSPEAARAFSLFQAGENLPAIVKELRGVSSSQGRRYQEALLEITDLLRQATKGA